MTPTERDTEMMGRALALAADAAAMGEVPIGAVVYNDARVLAGAHNRRETDGDPSAHAELIAIRDAARVLGDWRLERCSLAVTLEPCPMCAGAIVNSRIERLIYAAPDPKAGAVGTLFELCRDPRLNHRVREIHAGLCEHEAADLLRSFFKDLRTKRDA